MAATKNVRVAAAFQPGKDPQQDKIIEWLSNLPKDSRGGVKRSVMKYHLTRALLLYAESGLDSKSTLFGDSMSGGNSGNSGNSGNRASPLQSRETTTGLNAVPSAPLVVPQVATQAIPMLQDRVSPPSGGSAVLRGKIKRSMGDK